MSELTPEQANAANTRYLLVVRAAQRVEAEKFDTYRARNGRDCGIEDERGEKCWIVPDDAIQQLSTALSLVPEHIRNAAGVCAG